MQLSIDETQPASFHHEIGKRIAPLREEGVLIVGSGNLVTTSMPTHEKEILKRQTLSSHE